MTRDQTVGRGRCDFFFPYWSIFKDIQSPKILVSLWITMYSEKIMSQDTKCSLINFNLKILEATNLAKFFYRFSHVNGWVSASSICSCQESLLSSPVPRNLWFLPRLRDRAAAFLFAGSTSSEFSRITSTHTFVNPWVQAQTLWLLGAPAQIPASLSHPTGFYSPAGPAHCLQQACSSHTLVPRAQRPTDLSLPPNTSTDPASI